MKSFFEKPKPTLSFEIFPPKGEGKLNTIFETIDALASLTPDLISVTYGAAGTSREYTAEIASKIQNSYSIPAVAHLTCVGSTKEQMRETLSDIKAKNIKNILALRGDLSEETQLSDFHYASDLIKFIKEEHYDFKIFAGCYPEKHTEALTPNDDLINLKKKTDCGVDVLISQLFFDNDLFYKFRDNAISIGINTPIEAGIMPITSGKQIERIVSLCGASLPLKVQNLIKTYSHNSMAMKEAGIAYATAQIIDLLANGVEGIHLYTMNRPEIAKRIAENLRGILYSLRIKRGEK
ncbi:MAG: methylenetetrahydrofolate reductase [NAD(P)H] [Synergistaceae bacterium]